MQLLKPTSWSKLISAACNIIHGHVSDDEAIDEDGIVIDDIREFIVDESGDEVGSKDACKY
jgi:hypothetical protein